MKTIGCMLIGTALALGCAYTPDTQIIEYRKEVDKGDTVWDICASIATDEDNMQELVTRTLLENHIKDGEIHEGMEIIIHVPKKKTLTQELKEFL